MTKLGFAGVLPSWGNTFFKWQVLLGCFLVCSSVFASEATGVESVSSQDVVAASGAEKVVSNTSDATSNEAVSQVRPGSAVDNLITDPSYYLQILLVLAFVVGLIFVCAWLAKKINTGGFMGSQQMKLLGGLSVGTRERVVLVEVGEKQILLGVAPGRVNSLHVFDEPVITPEATEMSDFSRKLQQLLRKDVQRGVKAPESKSSESASTANQNNESKKCEE